MIERRSIVNPFERDVVTDPDRPAFADVPVIHHETFERCRVAYDSVADQARSWSVLMFGQAGCGKTHLLSRFRTWLNGGIEPRPRVAPALFVAVRMETGPGYVWRHLRRRFAEELTRHTANGADSTTPLDAILNRLAARAGGKMDEAFDHSPVADLGLDLTRVLELYAGAKQRRLCRAWLAGDTLTEQDYQSLNVAPPTADDADEDIAEFDARRVVLAIARLCAPAPVVYCFDQLEALALSGQNRSFGSFSRMGASLVDSVHNSLVISSTLSTFLRDIEDGSTSSDFERISKDRVDLHPLDWNLGNRLIQARLALVPGLANENPIPEKDLRAFYELQQGHTTPRRLIHEARRLFSTWQHRAEPSAPTTAEYLAGEFERLWSESPARANPAETDAVLAHGLPILIQLLGREAQDHPERHIDLGLGMEAGGAAEGSKLWLAFGNQGDMRSFSAWLKRVMAPAGSKARLCVVRDARLVIKPGAKVAGERIEKIRQGGGKLVRVEAEAVAALDAMRRLLARATSGDLNLHGNDIGPQTVREWLATNLPRGLSEFAEQLLGARPAPAQPPDALMEVLRARKVLPLEEAIRLSRVSQEQIENYARTHPDHLGLFGGSCPVVCQSVAAPARQQSERRNNGAL